MVFGCGWCLLSNGYSRIQIYYKIPGFQITADKKYHELINQLVERSGSILVFVKTKHGADKIVKRLKYDGHKADAIHGNLR